jgi:hypothetical protein
MAARISNSEPATASESSSFSFADEPVLAMLDEFDELDELDELDEPDAAASAFGLLGTPPREPEPWMEPEPELDASAVVSASWLALWLAP